MGKWNCQVSLNWCLGLVVSGFKPLALEGKRDTSPKPPTLRAPSHQVASAAVALAQDASGGGPARGRCHQRLPRDDRRGAGGLLAGRPAVAAADPAGAGRAGGSSARSGEMASRAWPKRKRRARTGVWAKKPSGQIPPVYLCGLGVSEVRIFNHSCKTNNH